MPAVPNTKTHGKIGRLKPYDVKNVLTQRDKWPLDEQAAAYILLFGEALGFWGERLYTGHTITHKGDVWWLTVRATHKGKHQVCFTSGPTQQDTIKHFAIGLVYEQLRWQKDNYKPKA